MAYVVVEAGPNRGAWFELPREGGALIGREAGAHVPLLDQRASRRHAQLYQDAAARWVLEDAGSRHGTQVNGLPVEEPVTLGIGDRIGVGDTLLRLEEGTPSLRFADAPPTVSLLPLQPLDPDFDVESIDPVEAFAPLAALAHAARDPERLAGVLLDLLGAAGGSSARIALGPRASALRTVVEVGTALEGVTLLSFPLRAGPGAEALLGELVVGTGGRFPPPLSPAWKAAASALGAAFAVGRPEAELPHGPPADASLIAESAAMRRVLGQVLKVAKGQASVLVTGESGTGKEVIANALHENSPRRKGAFVAVNAGALPGSLFESEVFGHERGAFTGAVARKKGLFELAHGGTLFLDEVGELTPQAQAGLLRVLETGEVRRVGGTDTVRVDVRVIAATHRDLQEMVKEGTFRQDLFYRLRVIELALPALRDRPQDIAPLCRALGRQLNGSGGAVVPVVTDDALEALLAYTFPGNVRELKNLLERALLLGDGRTVTRADLPEEVLKGSPLARGDAPFPTLAEVEQAHLARALAETKWVKKHAAELLKIDRKTLAKKVKDFGLAPGH